MQGIKVGPYGWTAIGLFLLLGIFLVWERSEHLVHPVKYPVRIAVSKTPLSAPLYVAEELGFFDRECVDVTLVDVVGGKRSFEHLMSGQSEFGTSSESVIVFKGFKRGDFVNLTTFVQSDNDVKIITREESGINLPVDFVGKRVAVVKGTASEYFLSIYLALDGVDIKQVELVAMSPEEMPEALANQQVEVIIPWEPYAYRAVMLMGGKASVLPAKNLYTLTFNLLTRKSYLESQPVAARCVISALSQAIDYISAHPVKAQQILQQRLNLDQNFIQWIWQDYIFKLSLSRSLMLTLESEARWAVQSGLTESVSVPDFWSLQDSRALTELKPAAVSIRRLGE